MYSISMIFDLRIFQESVKTRASNRKIVYDFYGFSYFYDLRFFWKPVKIVKTVKTFWPLFSTFCNNNDQFREVAWCYHEPISPWRALYSSITASKTCPRCWVKGSQSQKQCKRYIGGFEANDIWSFFMLFTIYGFY